MSADLRSSGAGGQIPVFEPVKLPRRDNGQLEFPRWACDFHACMEVLNEHGGNLGKVGSECVSLGLNADDSTEMVDVWSWTWVCSTLVWLRALRGDQGAEAKTRAR